MVEVVEETMVGVPPDEVWAVLADFGSIAHWAPNVDHSCMTTELAEGIGATRRVQVGRNVLLEEVVAWDPGERLSYQLSGLPPVVRSATNTWTLEPSDHGTRVVLTTAVDCGGRPPQQVVARIVGRVMAKASREMLGGIASELEGDPR